MKKFKTGSLVEQSGQKFLITQGWTPYEYTDDTTFLQEFNDLVIDLDGFQYGPEVRCVTEFVGTFKGTETETGDEVTFLRGVVTGPRGGTSKTWFVMYPDQVCYGNPQTVR